MDEATSAFTDGVDPVFVPPNQPGAVPTTQALLTEGQALLEAGQVEVLALSGDDRLLPLVEAAREADVPVILVAHASRPDGPCVPLAVAAEPATQYARASIDRLSAANLELVQMREHLQESEQRLKSAQRLTHVGSWHWNLGANQVLCSEECKRIFGEPEDYAPSLEGLLQIIMPHDRARVANEIQRGIAEKSGCSTEFRIVRPNGDLRTVTFTSQVFLDEEGSPRHILAPARMSPTIDARKRQPSPVRSWRRWEHWPMELHTTLTTCSAVC